MLLQVRAVAGRCAIQVHLFDQSAGHQRVEAVINRRQRDRRHMFFGPQKQFRGGRMTSLLQQHPENFFSLPSEPDPVRSQLMGNIR